MGERRDQHRILPHWKPSELRTLALLGAAYCWACGSSAPPAPVAAPSRESGEARPPTSTAELSTKEGPPSALGEARPEPGESGGTEQSRETDGSQESEEAGPLELDQLVAAEEPEPPPQVQGPARRVKPAARLELPAQARVLGGTEGRPYLAYCTQGELWLQTLRPGPEQELPSPVAARALLEQGERALLLASSQGEVWLDLQTHESLSLPPELERTQLGARALSPDGLSLAALSTSGTVLDLWTLSSQGSLHLERGPSFHLKRAAGSLRHLGEQLILEEGGPRVSPPLSCEQPHPRGSVSENPAARSRSYDFHSSSVSLSLPQGIEEARPGFLMNLGSAWLRRRPDGSLALVRAKREKTIAEAGCGARVLAAEARTQRMLLACEGLGAAATASPSTHQAITEKKSDTGGRGGSGSAAVKPKLAARRGSSARPGSSVRQGSSARPGAAAQGNAAQKARGPGIKVSLRFASAAGYLELEDQILPFGVDASAPQTEPFFLQRVGGISKAFDLTRARVLEFPGADILAQQGGALLLRRGRQLSVYRGGQELGLETLPSQLEAQLLGSGHYVRGARAWTAQGLSYELLGGEGLCPLLWASPQALLVGSCAATALNPSGTHRSRAEESYLLYLLETAAPSAKP